MKALFAHDHRFIANEREVWSESQFEAALWQRYLAHFDALTVAARRGTMPAGKSTAQLERSSAPGVTFELFPNLCTPRGLTVGHPTAWRRMLDLVKARDAVVARLPSEIGLLAIKAARFAGKPWAVEVVGCTWDGLWHYGSLSGRLYAPFAFVRMRRAVAAADHAIYVTHQFLQRRYPSSANNWATASNVHLLDVSPDVLHARMARIADSGNRPVRLGLIGTLRCRYKGIQTLFAALAQARAVLPPLELHILGAGDASPWQAEASRLGVDDLVVFNGTLPAGKPVLRWLDDVDLYLQPSLQEGMPRALIEAMSRGCPALASRVAGIPELLPSEDLIRPGDVHGLALLLKRRLIDLEWMKTRAQSNWEVAQNYRAEVLEIDRNRFWRKFANGIAGRHKASPTRRSSCEA